MIELQEGERDGRASDQGEERGRCMREQSERERGTCPLSLEPAF